MIWGRIQLLTIQKLCAAAKASVARMYYMNFDTKITAKYGIIIENWPLDHFLPPSHFKSKLELEVLLKAWESDSTRFRKLSTEEFERWQDTHIYHESSAGPDNESEDPIDGPPEAETDIATTQSAMLAALAIGASMPTMPPSSVAPPVIFFGTSTLQKRTRNSATLHDVVNVVGTAAGTAIPIVKKPQAPRSDKGKPRKKKALVAPEVATAGAMPGAPVEVKFYSKNSRSERPGIGGLVVDDDDSHEEAPV
ncbi:hypothetical protein OBBRIDRAFT_840342 [Obba rivulosa]|uniref:Uncharacterized protein n=1 Tax=Obba rivulosa TaxID=1052685 RepID=A0A8E2AGC1_9APHY|nr:hypothetical protein OBBRIDRAFT_840342 [Obba rivulosa]